jgi:hypothetical protein
VADVALGGIVANMRQVAFFWIATSLVTVAAIGGFYYAIALDGLRSQVICVPVIWTICVVVAQITYLRESPRKS